MDRDLKKAVKGRTLSRRDFVGYCAMAAGLLIVGSASGNSPSSILTTLRAKFKEMESYGIEPMVHWTDSTMRELLSSMSQINNQSTQGGKSEPFPVSGGNHEEQYRSLNGWLGRAPDAPFDDDCIQILERRF